MFNTAASESSTGENTESQGQESFPQVLYSVAKRNLVLFVVVFTMAFSFLLHALILNAPIYSDEVFYVAAANTIISHTSCGTLSTLESLQPCNLEHPPLAKLLMAASISAFGTGSMGVRLPSILAGVLSIPAITWLASSISGGSKRASISAGVLLAMSPTWFIMSSVGMLDSVELFFGILALALYFSKVGAGRGGAALSGLLFGFSILSKEDGLFALAGLLAYELTFGSARRIANTITSCLATVLAVLWAYDLAYTPFTNPIQQIQFIVSTGLALRNQGGYQLSPLQWFFQPREIVLALLALLWIPFAAATLYKKRHIEGRLLTFAFLFISATLIPLVTLYYLDGRQEYLFYEVQAIPALALGAGGLMGERKVPWRAAALILLVAVLLFAYFYPNLRSVYFS